MPTASIDVMILEEDEYRRMYQRAFAPVRFSGSLTREDVQREFETFDNRLRLELSKCWEEDVCGRKDFAISDEWQESWHHCGGIYSARIYCPQYVRIAIRVISALPHADRWTYHTAVEPTDDHTEMSLGEFFIRGGAVYAPQDGNDYKAVFGGSA